jgi:alkaline phosphatase D
MKRKLILVFFCFVLTIPGITQKNKWIVSGPMLAHTELRTAKVWIQFQNDIQTAAIHFAEKGKRDKKKIETLQLKGGEFNTAIFTLTALEPGRTYKYYITAKNEKQYADSGEVTTQDLWQWRKDPPDFSFIAGSCTYFNEPVYDRPGKPYGADSSIFGTMAKEKSAFMLWLGDNWYTRESDFFSDWGLFYRADRERKMPVLQPLLKAMPHYAIWDDHDYGPNDADKSYVLKEASRGVFKNYWGNPTYGINEQGVYSKFTWNDAEFFLLDDRWFRSSDKMPDSSDGLPNKSKKMFGDEQMEWLKNGLLNSSGNENINFRIVVTGSQVLNSYSPRDCFRHYPVEYNDLMKFISDHKINGVLFVTGDRHHSEVIKTERKGAYSLFDITVSPLTSTVSATGGAEKNNPARVSKETARQNYAKFSFTGPAKERKLSVEFIGIKGEKLDSWFVALKDISNTGGTD